MRKAGKVWGETQEVFANAAFELHRVQIAAGHQCSEHKHATKFNGFYVETGVLLVTVWQPTGTIDETTLQAGDSVIVPPGVYHRFRALTAVTAFETYWTELRSDDIERRTIGE